MDEYKDVEPLKKQIVDFKRAVKSENSDYLTGYISALSAVEEMIVGQPAADVAPVKHGHWIYGDFDIPHCSECGHEVMPNCISAFCPNCGAKMDMDGGEQK